jgi:protein-disulfide isomerase
VHRLAIAAILVACSSAPPPVEPTTPSNQAPPPAPVAGGVQYVGHPDAKVQVDYWFDYECPACVSFAPTLDAIVRRYGDQIVVYYRNFPLSHHARARPAAIAAEAARRQGKFIEMHRLLMARSPRLEDTDLRAAARELGLDLQRYDADVADPTASDAIAREYAAAEAAGISYVPFVSVNDVELTQRDEAGLSALIDGSL